MTPRLATTVLVVVLHARAAIHPPPIEWQTPLSAYWITEDLDYGAASGFVLALAVEVGYTRCALQRRDHDGTLLWERCLSSKWDNEIDRIQVAATADGGAALVLNTGADDAWEATCPLVRTSPAIGNRDCWILCVDADGNRVWDRTFGGVGREAAGQFKATADGGFILAATSGSGANGTKTAPALGGDDYWLVRLDRQGQLVWDRTFGGTAAEEALDVVELPDGGFVIAGYSESPADGNRTSPNLGGGDVWLVRVDAAGTKLWEAAFGGDGNDWVRRCWATATGEVVLAARSSPRLGGDPTQPPQQGLWIVRMDAHGVKRSEQVLQYGPGEITHVVLTRDGGFLAKATLDLFAQEMVRFDAALNPVWTWPTPASPVMEMPDAGFLFGAPDPDRPGEVLLLKTGPDGLSVPPQLRAFPQDADAIAATGYRLGLSGVSNQTYTIEHTTDWRFWAPVQTSTLAAAEAELLVPATNRTSGFYRARAVQ